MSRTKKIKYQTIYQLRHFAGKVFSCILITDHYFSSKKNKILNPQIVYTSGKSIAIYASHTEHKFDVWELGLFTQLNALGFQTITVNNFSMTDSRLDDFFRLNRGFDLAAHRDVINLFDSKPSELLLLNSSVAYDSNLTQMIENSRQISVASPTIVAATDSYQTKPHVQSYYFYAKGESVEKLAQVYREMKNWKYKRTAVTYGEIPILEKLVNLGCTCTVLYPYNSIKEIAVKSEILDKHVLNKIRSNVPINGSQHLWRELRSLGAPYIKRNLFTSNPAKVDGVPSSLEDVLNS